MWQWRPMPQPVFTASQASEIISEMLFISDIGLILLVMAVVRLDKIEHGAITNKKNIALMILLAGTVGIRGWSSATYLVQRFGGDYLTFAENTYVFALLCLVVTLCGVGFLIKLFSPPRWGNLGWMLIFSAAISYVGWMQVLR